jgi:UDP:flavonoid glycosyltransferase YjiC (YdhE family)
MNKRVCFFCVGTGGHVLPVRNLIKELKELGTNNEDILFICDNRGKQYLDNLDVSIHTPENIRFKERSCGIYL